MIKVISFGIDMEFKLDCLMISQRHLLEIRLLLDEFDRILIDQKWNLSQVNHEWGFN